MPKAPPAPTSVQAEFSQDTATGEWVATALVTPRISIRAVEIRRARRLLTQELEQRLGKDVELVEKVKLPKGIAERVSTYQSKVDKMKALREEIDGETLPLIKELLKLHLQGQQVAALLGLSPAWVSQILKQEATGKYRNTPKE